MTPILNNTTPRVTPMPNQSLYSFYPVNVPQTVSSNPYLPQPTVLQSPAFPVQPLGVNVTNYSGPPPMYNAASFVPTPNYSSASIPPKIYPTLEPKLENSEPIQSQQKSSDKVTKIQESNKKDISKNPKGRKRHLKLLNSKK